MDLSTAKILVVLVVALLVLGPDKLPGVARQVGRYANEFRQFRDGLHSEVSQAFGDPRELSAIPGRSQEFMDSVTAQVLSATSTGPSVTPTPQGGPSPGDVSSPAGPGGEVAPPDPATGVAPDESAGSGFERGFN